MRLYIGRAVARQKLELRALTCLEWIVYRSDVASFVGMVEAAFAWSFRNDVQDLH